MMRKAIFSSATIALLLASTQASAIDPNAGKTKVTPVLAASDDGSGRKVAGVGGIFGCSADGSKQTVGAVAGGAIGGILGNRIAGRGSRTLGTILGGAIGAAAGSAVGCKLQKNDQAKAERAMENAVLTGEDQSWQSDETGAWGKVEVGDDVQPVALSKLKFAPGVEPVDGYSKVGGAFVSTAKANVRAAPGTNAKVLGQLTAGQRVWVPAAVQGQPWVLVSSQGVAHGYVSAPLLRKSTTTASNCRLIKQTVATPGASEETETLQACKGTNGEWTMTRV